MSDALAHALASGGSWALPAALLAGFVAGLNPCCLALSPAVAATCCVGASSAGCGEPRGASASRALAFILGASTTMTALGVLAAALGHAVVSLGRGPRYALALLPIVMGLHLLGWIRLPLPFRVAGLPGGGALAAFGAGLLASLVLGSCATPVLAGILSYAAYSGSLAFGALLLFSYGIGNGLPLLALGTGAGELSRRLARTRAGAWAERFSGALLVGLGFTLLVRV